MKYAMLICTDENEWADVDPAARDEGMKDVYAWFEKWGPTGKIADGGAELDSTRTAKTIRPGDRAGHQPGRTRTPGPPPRRPALRPSPAAPRGPVSAR